MAADLILEVVEGAHAGHQQPLDGPIDVGRDPRLPVVLDADPQVSPRHARLTPQAGGAVVEDLGSAAGTFVNDQPIRAPRPVRAGDRVRIGLSVVELRSARAVTERPSAVRPRPWLTEAGHGVIGAVPLPPQHAPPLGGRQQPAPALEPGVGFRAAQAPVGYVPAEVVGARGDDDNDEDEWRHGGIGQMRDAPVKAQRNVAAFVLLGSSALAVLLYFGLT